MEILDTEFYGNPVGKWGIAVVLLLFVYFGLQIIKRIVKHRLIALAKLTNIGLDRLSENLLSRTRIWFLFAVALYIASHILSLPDKAFKVIDTVTIIALILQAGLWVAVLYSFWMEGYLKIKTEDSPEAVTSLNVMNFLGRIAIWTLALLLILDNLGVNITALITGLGIGGVAVALALQNVLGDLFASLTIVLDKPFLVGDFIIVDDLRGSVEHIGLKTTRIRSLSGEQLVFPNSNLLQSRIRNYKRMENRRIVFSFGVTYQTPYEKLKTIPRIVKEQIQSMELCRFDRAHFFNYGDSSLDFEVVYYVDSAEYATYMDKQQEINLHLFKRFEQEGIEFAYPTRTLYIEKSGSTT